MSTLYMVQCRRTRSVHNNLNFSLLFEMLFLCALPRPQTLRLEAPSCTRSNFAAIKEPWKSETSWNLVVLRNLQWRIFWSSGILIQPKNTFYGFPVRPINGYTGELHVRIHCLALPASINAGHWMYIECACNQCLQSMYNNVCRSPKYTLLF